MISICTAFYRAHAAPNVASLVDELPRALGGRAGELVVALNGISAREVCVGDRARVLEFPVNRGVAPAWNAAARAAHGDVLVFCNDDVALGARSLEQLAQTLENVPDAGVVGPIGSRWDIATGRHLGDVHPDERAGHTLLRCDAVSGFLFACTRPSWREVGGFDECYAPASWEEVDFCTAVRASGGACYAVAGITVRHEWGVSKRQMPWARAHWDGRSETWRSIHRRNRRHFVEKWSVHPIASTSREKSLAR